MNVELLRKVQKAILAEPRQFVMEHFFLGSSVSDPNAFPNCGTAACIGGWAIAIELLKTPKDAVRIIRDQEQSSHARAQVALGLSDEQADALFYTTDWPKEYTDRFYSAPPQTLERAQAAADRIDHFIKTGE